MLLVFHNTPKSSSIRILFNELIVFPLTHFRCPIWCNLDPETMFIIFLPLTFIKRIPNQSSALTARPLIRNVAKVFNPTIIRRYNRAKPTKIKCFLSTRKMTFQISNRVPGITGKSNLTLTFQKTIFKMTMDCLITTFYYAISLQFYPTLLIIVTIFIQVIPVYFFSGLI